MKKLITFIVIVLTIFSCAKNVVVQPRKLHTGDEILKIMEESELNYTIATLDSSVVLEDSLIVLDGFNYLEKDENGYALHTYQPSDSTMAVFNTAEDYFSSKNYEKALEYYERAYELEPSFAYSLTMIGDTYYTLGKYESAKDNFLKAIKQNPLDFRANWFLADTYAKLGEDRKANEFSIRAHLMNRNHLHARNAMIIYGNSTGKIWSEWDFVPRYRLSAQDKKVMVEVGGDWFGYAMVKAVWRYEPGYAQMMDTAGSSDKFNVLCEREAVIATMANEDYRDIIEKVVKAGYIDEFIYYEIFSREQPLFLLLLPEEALQRIIEYIKLFHYESID